MPKIRNVTDGDEVLNNEEILSMLLRHGKQLSEASGVSVRDCAITVPSYFSAGQKQMIVDAADLAGLSVSQLVHENVAAALMYGLNRLDTNKTHTVLFYNMGGRDTEVAIVNYSTIVDPKTNTSNEHVEIVAEAWDETLGGSQLDLVILDLLAERFNSMEERAGKADVRDNPRAVKRLIKESTRIKDVLSANK